MSLGMDSPQLGPYPHRKKAMRKKLTWILIITGHLLGSSLYAQTAFPELQKGITMPLAEELQGTVNAPDFPSGAQWLNVDSPISLKDLKGKVVLLDFWTFCCINCMHVIPDLHKLEEKYPNELVVIGVHSAKFNSEKDSENIRNAILRYEIHHPVINDKDFQVWSSYGVRAWPSFALIDPNGKVVGMTSGENVYDLLEPYIEGLVKHYKAEGQLNLRPLVLHLEKDKKPAMPLSFPGKVSADKATDTLIVSDSDHNRILVLSLDGKVKDVIGGKAHGFKDGSFETARFFRPQGVDYDAASGVIYVADTENHAIREIDLKKRTVKTLAGTGHQARQYNVEGTGTSVALNSPWDVLKIGDLLYIAMAGSHQIWTLDLKSRAAKIYAGSAYENIVDDKNFKKAALAQTSGLTTDGSSLFFVDSETSSLRVAALPPNSGVSTFIGTGLFDFGDKDGDAKQALLQHPIGIAYHDGLIYVADTYNNKVKAFDPKTRVIRTVIGNGQPGYQDGLAAQALLNEPCGLTFAGDKLYIADTNNNLIRVWDPKSGQVSTLTLSGLEKMHPMKTEDFKGEKVTLEAQTVTTGDQTLQVNLKFPEGLGLNPEAPSRWEAVSSNETVVKPGTLSGYVGGNMLSVPLRLAEGKAALSLTLHLYYCSHGKESLCYFKEVQLQLPLTIQTGSANLAPVVYTIKR